MPAARQHSAEVARSGCGFHTARATGSLGSGSSGPTTVTSLSTSRNRSFSLHRVLPDAEEMFQGQPLDSGEAVALSANRLQVVVLEGGSVG
jgi:hypothetical protein